MYERVQNVCSSVYEKIKRLSGSSLSSACRPGAAKGKYSNLMHDDGILCATVQVSVIDKGIFAAAPEKDSFQAALMIAHRHPGRMKVQFFRDLLRSHAAKLLSPGSDFFNNLIEICHGRSLLHI